jgi:hypothetical protein
MCVKQPNAALVCSFTLSLCSDDARLSLFDTTPEELAKMAWVTEVDQMDVLNKQKDAYTNVLMANETGSVQSLVVHLEQGLQKL